MEVDHNWYNEAYAKSTEYRKEPEDSIYIEVWNKAISLIKNERILDFGCGPGQFAKLLLKNGKRFVKGYDFSNEAIILAQRANPQHKRLFVVKDLLKIEKVPAYDLVICFEVLEHITQDLEVIKKVGSGKRFIFSVPNYDYKSHVRKFETEDEIIQRYSKLLDVEQIFRIPMSNKNMTTSLAAGISLIISVIIFVSIYFTAPFMVPTYMFETSAYYLIAIFIELIPLGIGVITFLVKYRFSIFINNLNSHFLGVF